MNGQVDSKRELAREALKEADEYVAFAVGESLEAAKRRIVELETAVTDALWAYGIVRENIDQYWMCSGATERDVKEAEARIQKARAALRVDSN